MSDLQSVIVQDKGLAHTVLLRAQVLNEANVCQVFWLLVIADHEKNVQFCISESKITLTNLVTVSNKQHFQAAYGYIP